MRGCGVKDYGAASLFLMPRAAVGHVMWRCEGEVLADVKFLLIFAV